ncbi:MAG TPA: ATP-binding protein [Actinomycetota bacterium]|nr:ATP-binding protein [Actinomycetota bacterium]
MVAYHRSSALHAYVLAVSVLGLCVLALLGSQQGLTMLVQQPPLFWALLACLIVVESFPILSSGSGGTQVATTAEAFAFAILLGQGRAAATFALVLGLLVADVLRRVGPERILFNIGQYSLLMATAGSVYQLLGGGGPFGPRHLPAFAVAAAVFFLGNLVLVGVVTTFAYGRDFAKDLKECLRIEARPYTMVFGMAPISLVVAQYSIGLLPLLLLPLFGVREALKTAEEANERRMAAERGAEQARAIAEEQARLVEAERALVERLRESDRLKDDLLAAVSHELRTPLAGMLGALSTLSAREGQLTDPQRQELTDMAARQGERLKVQIEQLLLAARLDHSGHEAAARPVVDAAVLTRQAVAAARAAYPARQLVLKANEVLPVRAVPEAVLQVLGNLLDNAAKHAPDKAPIRVEARREGPLAVLAVEDAGPGVPPADRERIFERFTQLDSGATRRAGGVGLGLHIARQLANAQGGELLLTDPAPPRQGARFELRLPMAELAFRRPG